MTASDGMRVAFQILAHGGSVQVRHVDGCEVTFPQGEDVDVNTVFDSHRAAHWRQAQP